MNPELIPSVDGWDLSEWEDHVENFLREQPDLQTWDHHTRIRLRELHKIATDLKEVREQPPQRMLELGCGNGIGCAYLGAKSDLVVGSDLPAVDPETHSIGLEKAGSLLATLLPESSAVVGCSGESLPFQNSSFDLVMGIYVLEHISDKRSALEEARRVLRPGGQCVMSVPAFAWSLTYPIVFYVELLKRTLVRLLRAMARTTLKRGNSADAPNHRINNLKGFKEAYTRFPFPQPHGAYRTYSEELWQQRTERWLHLFREAGFRIDQVTPLTVLPRSLMTSVAGQLGLRVHERLQPVDDALSRRTWAPHVAQFITVIGTKDG